MKISDLETNIFELNMMVKSGLVFYLEILLAPSELRANLTGQLSLSGQHFLHWEAATVKGLVEFQNEKKLDHFSPSYLTKKMLFSRSESLVYLS